MIWTLAYFLVAAGCNEGGMKFGDAIIWPWSVGRMIAAHVKLGDG